MKRNMTGAVSVAGDILAGAPVLKITGQSELYLENYSGIVEYTGDSIRVQTKTGRIHIEGKRLNIHYYTNDEMKITGHIERITY